MKKFLSFIDSLSLAPGFGKKAAKKFYIFLFLNKDFLTKTIEDLTFLRDKIHFCNICNNLAENILCEICSDLSRNRKILCIVDKISSLFNIEKLNFYHGIYFILNNNHNLIENNSIEEIYLKYDFLNIEEVILAIGFDQINRVNAFYIKDLIKNSYPNIKITILANGIPHGSDLDHIDQSTILLSLQNRQDL